MKLVAKFVYAFPGYGLFVCTESGYDKIYQTTINEFDISVDLYSCNKGLVPSSQENSGPIYQCLQRVTILVARNEKQLGELERNGDIREIIKLINNVRPEFIKTVVEVLNNLISYFKYRLNNPNLSLVNEQNRQLLNPLWENESGKSYKYRVLVAIGELLPRQSYFGIKCFSEDFEEDFEKAIEKRIDVSIYNELLSDAQIAVFENNLRRGALELAIATEILVKNYFFKQDTFTSVVYEYLADKHKISVRIDELIDGVAKQALGESFKTHDSNAYNNIVNLFRCRNKIAHHGKTEFSDENGLVIHLTKEILKDWWESVQSLNDWLLSKSR